MNKDITLREHLSKIAKNRHKALKAKLGKKGYADLMSKVSKGQKLDIRASNVLE